MTVDVRCRKEGVRPDDDTNKVKWGWGRRKCGGEERGQKNDAAADSAEVLLV